MVFESLVEAIADVLEVNEDEVSRESRFVEDLGADSLDVMEIIMALEEKFSIKISVDTISHIKTVGDAAAEIEKVINQ